MPLDTPEFEADGIHESFDRDSTAHRRNRDKICKAIERTANDAGFDGVVTCWIVIAEVCSSEDGVPKRTLFMDDAYYDGFGMVSWTIRGLLDEARDEYGL